MSIETDGTLTPREAFLKALDILMGQLEELKTLRRLRQARPIFHLLRQEIARVQGTACDRLAEQLGGFLQGTDWSAAGGGL